MKTPRHIQRKRRMEAAWQEYRVFLNHHQKVRARYMAGQATLPELVQAALNLIRARMPVLRSHAQTHLARGRRGDNFARVIGSVEMGRINRLQVIAHKLEESQA